MLVKCAECARVVVSDSSRKKDFGIRSNDVARLCANANAGIATFCANANAGGIAKTTVSVSKLAVKRSSMAQQLLLFYGYSASN
jgi:hypothetical protein